MPTIAVIGAGPLAGALAHTLAGRNRVRAVRLIDPDVKVAQGKALDILQSSPVERFSTTLDAADSVAAASGADAIVIADLVSGEISGEPGLALLRQLSRVESSAPFVFAGSGQRELLARARTELHIASSRLIGSAPFALESSVRAVVAALVDTSPREISVAIAGVPPRHAVIGWDAATAFGQPLAAVLAAHHMAAVSSRLPGLWPPSPYTLASAASRVAEGAALGSRRRYTCFAVLQNGAVAAVPIALARGGIGQVIDPALSRHERTAFENGLERIG
jgi:lactate/malate dehydrogenase, NAD binding domain